MKTINLKKNESKTILLLESGTWEINLAGEGAKVKIVGIFIGKKDDHFKVRTIQHHLAPNTKSDLLVKSILFDNSKFDYNGLIKIEKTAQHSDAYQRNENLVMNDDVKVDTKPELEILANEVRCTHGATIGKIKSEDLFYLQSRGLTKKQAEKILIEGFVESMLEHIDNNLIIDSIRKYLYKSLSLYE